MSKKEIQRQRMMSYFIEAAKKIIVEEGVKNITVRKVADLAGYSYATIYNFFKDLDTLMLYCANEFLKDCYEYVQSKKHPLSGVERVKSLIISYVEYFLEYPHAFQIVFIEDIQGELPDEIAREISNPTVALLLSKALDSYVKAAGITSEDAQVLKELIINFIHGRILFYIKRNINKNHRKFIQDVCNELDYILR